MTFIKLLFLPLSVLFFTLTQVDNQAIEQAFKGGNAANVGNYFEPTIDLKLPDAEEQKMLSKAEAVRQLQIFLDQLKVKNFEKISEREMSANMYIVGKLIGEAKQYNVTLMLKKQQEKLKIISIRIN